jgi:predicted TPR repeat methyltransferase
VPHQNAQVVRLFTEARQHYATGQLEAAERLFHQVLALYPDHAQSLCSLGVIAHSRTDLPAARALFERALAIKPDLAEAHNSLGIVLLAEAQAEVPLAQAQAEAAVGHFQQALRTHGGYLDAHNNLAMTLLSLGRFEAAVTEWRQVLATNGPAASGADICIVKALYGYHLADRDGARALSWVVRTAYPERPILQHGTAGILGEAAPVPANLEYVRALFDFFAGNFDAALTGLLRYSPKPLIDVLAEAIRPGHGAYDILDAGCGTGLCAAFLRPWARRLVGCDLSPEMLARARQRQAYDELVPGELTAFLNGRPAAFDLIVAADVLIYFGALEPLLSAVVTALRPGGLFAFSVETLEDTAEAAADNFAICPSGHYKHTQKYVTDAAERSNLRVMRAHVASLRLELGSGEAKGLMVIVKK